MGTVLLGMSLNFFHSVRVAHDLEVEAPSTGNAGLPEVLAFVMLLGPQRRVSEIFQEQQRLFVKGALNFFRSLVVVPSEVRGEIEPHLPARLVVLVRSLAVFLCNEVMKASWVSNGPKERPCLYSFSLCAMPRSMARRCACVYSLSAFGNWVRSITSLGVMTILPRWSVASTRSPSATPMAARRRLGNVICPLR